MRRTTVLFTALLLALAMMAGPAFADHVHQLETPGNTVILPCEPEHVGAGDPTSDRASTSQRHRPDVLHPIHNFLHKGPGAPSDDPDSATGPVSVSVVPDAPCY